MGSVARKLLKKLKENGVYDCLSGQNAGDGDTLLGISGTDGGGSLLTKDLKANLTSKLAQDGIKYWVKMHKEFFSERFIEL